MVLVIFLLVGLLVVVSLIPIKGNYKLFSVMSGSMEPDIPTGSLIFSKPALDYQVGDVITFYSGTKKSETTTHRITLVEISDSGKLFTTKGDSNDAPDLKKVTEEKVIGKKVASIALVGYILGYTKTLPGLFIVIIIPAAIIIYDELNKMKNEAKDIIQRRKAKKKAVNNEKSE